MTGRCRCRRRARWTALAGPDGRFSISLVAASCCATVGCEEKRRALNDVRLYARGPPRFAPSSDHLAERLAPTTTPDRRQDRTLPQPLPTRPNYLSRSLPIGTGNLERTQGRHPRRFNPGSPPILTTSEAGAIRIFRPAAVGGAHSRHSSAQRRRSNSHISARRITATMRGRPLDFGPYRAPDDRVDDQQAKHRR